MTGNNCKARKISGTLGQRRSLPLATPLLCLCFSNLPFVVKLRAFICQEAIVCNSCRKAWALRDGDVLLFVSLTNCLTLSVSDIAGKRLELSS